MKNTFFLAIIIIIGITIYSCTKKDTKNPTEIEKEEKENVILGKKYYIFYATWDEWGRASRDCKGWGLCNAVSCAFCCVENDVIVDCGNNQKITNVGKIVVDDDTQEGEMFIELDPQIPIQSNAIDSSLTLYVDNNIENNDFIIHSGNYHFLDSIGNNGGYKLLVTKK